ncbi:MAG: type IV pili methyl-accepting chemotaxis transducer N-terminal domain-containing protein [Pseudomonadota bacterium]
MRSLALSALIAVTALSPIAPAYAGDIEVTADSVAKRIDVAGRQRMLLERMAKYFCFARSNVSPMESAQALAKAKDLFARTHTGFRVGDPEQGLFEETSKGVGRHWENVDLLWVPLQATYDAALSGTFVDEDAFERSMRMTLEVRKRANDMVAEMRGAYAAEMGDAGVGESILIDLYGRQRMLSQKLSKEVCLVARGTDLEGNTAELNATLELFETSLNAFIEGMPIAGIPKPPTEAIAAQLAIANGEWQPIRNVAATIASGGAVNLTDLATFAQGTDRFLVEMNKAVKLLAAQSAGTS